MKENIAYDFKVVSIKLGSGMVAPKVDEYEIASQLERNTADGWEYLGMNEINYGGTTIALILTFKKPLF